MLANICSVFIIVHMFENGNGAKENSFSSTVHLFDVSQFIPSLIVVRVFLARLDKNNARQVSKTDTCHVIFEKNEVHSYVFYYGLLQPQCCL